MSLEAEPREELLMKVDDLSLRLQEAQETLEAIRTGGVDALVVRDGKKERIYTLQGADTVYRRLFNTLSEGVLTFATDGTILYANRRFADMVGIPLSRILGAPVHCFVAPADVERFQALLCATGEECGRDEIVLDAGGQAVPVIASVSAEPLEESQEAWTAVFADLTELRQAQDALREANVELEARVQERTAELMAQSEELELTNEELRSQSEELVATNDELRAKSVELVATNDELQRQRAALAEADRRKDEFLAMLGHELRNPLAAISSGLQVLRRHLPEVAQAHRAADAVARQSQHMARLLDDLLDVSRITRGAISLRRTPLDLAEVLEQAVQVAGPLMRERHHDLLVSLPPMPVRVEADPDRLSQIVTNLLTNAAKYTPPGGQVRLSALPGEGEAIIRVRDNGIGIPPALLPRVFDLFVQAERSADRSEGGLGIGLTLVRQLVALHGGRVEAFSEGVGKGSEFVVHLPAAGSRLSGHGSGEGALRPEPGPRRRVLVVDDNEDSAEMLAMLLELAGHEVVTAHSGPAALDLAVGYLPDVVLLDIGLPRMDGLEVARRLRRVPALADTLLVALTGYGQDEDRAQSYAAGFDHHLVKPVDIDLLRRVLQEVPPTNR